LPHTPPHHVMRRWVPNFGHACFVLPHKALWRDIGENIPIPLERNTRELAPCHSPGDGGPMVVASHPTPLCYVECSIAHVWLESRVVAKSCICGSACPYC
jgi:hypothetical protein